MNVGENVVFNFTGASQRYVIPHDGLYKFECWGARGGHVTGAANGGYGAYVCGYKYMHHGDVLFVVCGGKGQDLPSNPTIGGKIFGGFNGGGKGDNNTYLNPSVCAPGGGLTHIATIDGELKNIAISKALLVAPGGGGAAYCGGWGIRSDANGGDGGITTGSNGSGDDASVALSPTVYSNDIAHGGSQSQGGKRGTYSWSEHTVNAEYFPAGGNYDSSNGSYGLGGNNGGGGGYYGGGGGVAGFHDFAQGQNDFICAAISGAGGSAFLGGIPTIIYKDVTYAPVTQVHANYDNGYAKITLIDKTFPSVQVGSLVLTGMQIGNVNISGLQVGDRLL